MRSVLVLQSVGEAGVGIGIFYIDESGSLLFLLLFFSGFRFAGEVSVSFLFLLSCERVEAWAMLRVCSFPLLVAVPVMAVLFLEVAVAFSFGGLGVELRFSGCVDDGGQGAESKDPTTDALFPRISCSFPKLGVRSLIWNGGEGGLKIWGEVPCSGRFWRQLSLGKKINSVRGGLFVIFVTSRDLSARKSCTVQTLFLI